MNSSICQLLPMKTYNPPRSHPGSSGDPLEIELVHQVRPCGSCSFFWPQDVNDQPYGPFPIFDFTENTPKGNQPEKNSKDYLWLKGITRNQGFPNPEIMDGCRKAPIMTIGINPNLTAFAPGIQGADWAYPGFTDADGTQAETKYAYYYRYRSVYQEHLPLHFIEQHLDSAGQILAEKPGILTEVKRTSDAPGFSVTVQYDGDDSPTVIELNRSLGSDRYVVLFNHYDPDNRFRKGDIIASKIHIPPDLTIEVFQEQIGYYMQFVPVLKQFEDHVKQNGHPDVHLQMGEDVCQLDMVACASPHWNEAYLGGKESEKTIISNCVHKNAWAVKQLIQTKPAILFLVGESSYNMFQDSFYKLINRDIDLPRYPEDGAFTLFRETIDPEHPTYIEFRTQINDRSYNLKTRLIVTPHFSYNSNFQPQFRMSEKEWKSFQNTHKDCSAFLLTDKRVEYVAPEKSGYFVAFIIREDLDGVLSEIKTKYPTSWHGLMNWYYHAHDQMAEVLNDLYDKKDLTYTSPNGQNGYLTRTDGSCHFCVNEHWSFPEGCPYGKNKLQPPPKGYLEQVAKEFVAAGKYENT